MKESDRVSKAFLLVNILQLSFIRVFFSFFPLFVCLFVGWFVSLFVSLPFDRTKID